MYFEVRADLFIAKQTFTNMLVYPALAMGGVQEATKQHSLERLSGEEPKHTCILLREEQTHCSEQVCRYIYTTIKCTYHSLESFSSSLF